MNNTKAILGTAWRSVVVAIGYCVGLMADGMLGGLLGWRVPSGSNTDNQTSMVVMLVSAILLGVIAHCQRPLPIPRIAPTQSRPS